RPQPKGVLGLMNNTCRALYPVRGASQRRGRRRVRHPRTEQPHLADRIDEGRNHSRAKAKQFLLRLILQDMEPMYINPPLPVCYHLWVRASGGYLKLLGRQGERRRNLVVGWKEDSVDSSPFDVGIFSGVTEKADLGKLIIRNLPCFEVHI